MTGINGTGDGEISPESIAGINSDWERLVLLPHFDLREYIARCHARGIKALGLIARESLSIPLPSERWPYEQWLSSLGSAHSLTGVAVSRSDGVMSYNDAASFYADRYGDVLDAWQIGNESDHVSPSSWTLSHSELNWLLLEFRQRLERAFIVGPGLVSGDAEWARGIDLRLINALAVHGYGQRPYGSDHDWDGLPGNFGVITELFDRYASVIQGSKSIWATEFGLSTTETSELMQARYIGETVKTLNEYMSSRGGVAFAFCMGDWMVPEFGLYRADGTPKAAAYAFRQASPAVHQPEPLRDDAAFQLGFAKWAALEPWLIGSAVKNERNTGFYGWQIQPTTTGVLQWHVGDGHIFVTHDGRVFRWTEDLSRSIEVFDS